MSAPTDFLRLYQELGLAPGATFDDLKRAYRRRVSELHPDRAGSTFSAAVPGAAERLQQITQLYNAATHFHRQHGRLPGAASPPRPVASAPRYTPPPPSREPKRSSRGPWLLLIAAALGIWLVSAPPWSTTAPDAAPPAPPRRLPRAYVAPLPLAATPAEHGPALKLGMHEEDVLAIEGQPVSRSTERWDYGPSWIAFQRHRVSDWYSSALRPLKGASRRPPPPAEEEEPIP